MTDEIAPSTSKPEPIEPEESLPEESDTLEKCPVCLQCLQKAHVSYASSCLHSFCLECLIQWSRIKYSCPLCKRGFDRILFSVRTSLEFKELQFRPATENRQSVQSAEIIEYLPAPGSSEANSANTSLLLGENRPVYSKASWVVHKEAAPVEFRMLVYLNEWYTYRRQIQYYTDLSELCQDFRLEIDFSYQKELAECISYRKVKGFRDISSRWFKNNPASTHRLMQFIYREIKALACVLKSNPFSNYLNIGIRSHFMSTLINRLKMCDLNSEEFLDTIIEFVKVKPLAEHFQHELISYASSSSTSLIDYDAKCVLYTAASHSQKDSDSPNPPQLHPVNICKYRLQFKVGFVESTTATPALIVLDMDDSTPVYESDSDFCQEVQPSPKPSPQYIVLSSESESNRSEISRSRRRRHHSKKKSRSHSSKAKKSSSRSHKKKRRSKSRKRHKSHSSVEFPTIDSGDKATTSRTIRHRSESRNDDSYGSELPSELTKPLTELPRIRSKKKKKQKRKKKRSRTRSRSLS